jgi:methionyl-tRNA synthetase
MPFMPAKAAEMRDQLGLDTEVGALTFEDIELPGDSGWQTVNKPSPLFPKIEAPV